MASAVAEQATAIGHIANAADSMRVQAEQTDRAMKEQARTMKEMHASAQNTGNQIRLITNANREHSTVSTSIISALADIRQVTERNAGGVRRTRDGAKDLLKRTAALTARAAAPSARQDKRRPRSNGA